MGRTGGRAFQTERTANAKALRRSGECRLQEWKEASVAGAEWLTVSLDKWEGSDHTALW